jgi:predicted nucleic-acid-binding protein
MDNNSPTFLADANIFLRFLTKDVLGQALKVKKIFEEAESGKLKIFLLHITAVEILFQLEHWYQFSKNEAAEKLISLFSPSWLIIEDKEIVLTALDIYKTIPVDFVDLLTWSLAKKRHLPILSFDKDYDKLEPRLRREP